MSPNLSTVLATAESLPVAGRRELIDLPSAAPEGGTPVLSAAWRQEVARRSAEYDAGQAETVSWQEVQMRWQVRRAEGSMEEI